MSAALDAATAAIKQRFDTLYKATFPNELISYPNARFLPGKTLKPWARLTIRWGAGLPETMDGVNTTAGVIFVSIFVPKGTGEGELLKRANTVRDIFNRQDISGVRCEVAGGPEMAEDAAWMQSTVKIPFTFDETN
jgi:hypothetical protein